MVSTLSSKLDSLILKSLPCHPSEIDERLENSSTPNPDQTSTTPLRIQQLEPPRSRDHRASSAPRLPVSLQPKRHYAFGRRSCWRTKTPPSPSHDFLKCSSHSRITTESWSPPLRQALAQILRMISVFHPNTLSPCCTKECMHSWPYNQMPLIYVLVTHLWNDWVLLALFIQGWWTKKTKDSSTRKNWCVQARMET